MGSFIHLLIMPMTTTNEVILHKDDLEQVKNKLQELHNYLIDKELYVNSLNDKNRFNCEVCSEFEDITTMFHVASMKVWETLRVRNQLMDHMGNRRNTNENN